MLPGKDFIRITYSNTLHMPSNFVNPRILITTDGFCPRARCPRTNVRDIYYKRYSRNSKYGCSYIWNLWV